MADWTDLDAAFSLPEHIAEEFRELFEHLVARVRQETEHLPLNTLVQLQIERNLTTYIDIKNRERHPVGHAEGFATVPEAQAQNKLWLDLTKALNDQVFKIKASDRRAVRDEVMARVTPVLSEFIKRLPDEHRERLRGELVGLLEQAGV